MAVTHSFLFITGFLLIQNGLVSASSVVTCNSTHSFIHIPGTAQVYYSYYFCSNTTGSEPRSTIIFVGTPERTGSGYFESSIMDSSVVDDELWDEYDLIFIDVPGVGYSFINNSSYFNKISTNLANDTATAILGIINNHSKIGERFFYLFAEGWGTKLVPSVSLILYNLLSVDQRNNFQGTFLSSPFVSPLQQIQAWPDVLYYQGFIDMVSYVKLQIIVGNLTEKVSSEKWEQATRSYKGLESSIRHIASDLDVCHFGNPVCLNDFEELVGLSEGEVMRDLISLISCPKLEHLNGPFVEDLSKVLNKTDKGTAVKQDLAWNSQELRVIKELGFDLLKSRADDIVKMLDETNLNVFILTGHNDLVSAPTAVLTWLQALNWTGSDTFNNNEPYTAFTDDFNRDDRNSCRNKVGYVKKYGLLQFFSLYEAGNYIVAEDVVKLKRVFDFAITGLAGENKVSE